MQVPVSLLEEDTASLCFHWLIAIWRDRSGLVRASGC